MSKRLIDANELISAMYYYEHNEGGLTAYDAQDIINKAPTIEPKRGEWKEIKRYWEINQWVYEIECSVCKERIKNPYEPYFCPNCGADMRKESE